MVIIPCYLRVAVTVTDEVAARDALKFMKLQPEDHIRKLYGGKEFDVMGLDVTQKREFKQRYGVSLATRTVKKKYYSLVSEEKQKDGSVKLRFRR